MAYEIFADEFRAHTPDPEPWYVGLSDEQIQEQHAIDRAIEEAQEEAYNADLERTAELGRRLEKLSADTDAVFSHADQLYNDYAGIALEAARDHAARARDAAQLAFQMFRQHQAIESDAIPF